MSRVRANETPIPDLKSVRPSTSSVAAEPVDEVRYGQWARIEEALEAIAVERNQTLTLQLVLDAFGDDFELHMLADRDHRFGERMIDGARELSDEQLVDLELVERQHAQIGQRGVARAEIVHRHTQSEAAQRVELFNRFIDIVE